MEDLPVGNLNFSEEEVWEEPSCDNLKETHHGVLSRPVSMSTSRELPIELLFDIILRLEVKDVIRCSVVSKPIYSMIKTPSFVNEHLHRSEKKAVATGTNVIVVSLESGESGRDTLVHLLSPESKVIVQPPPVDGNLRLLASCNGLLFFARAPEMNLCLLWNPATKKCRILPTPHFNRCTVLGFGYDAGSGCYKVVKISYCSPKKPYLVEVWSTSTNRWTEVKDTILPRVLEGYQLPYYQAGCFVKGHLYWLVSLQDNRRGPHILLSFALGNDSFRQITLPDAYAFAVGSREFVFLTGELMGSIALFYKPTNTPVSIKIMLDIWVMEDNDGKDSWTKMPSLGPFPWHVWPATVFINGKFLMKKLARCDELKVGYAKYFLYDPCTKEETALPFKGQDGRRFWSWSESLVSVTEHGNNHEYTDLIDLVDTEISDAIKRDLENMHEVDDNL